MNTEKKKGSHWLTWFLLGVIFIAATGAAVFSTLPAPTIADTIADAIQLDRRAFTSSGRGFVYVERYDTNSQPWPQPRKLHYVSGSTLSTNGSFSRAVFSATGGRLVFRDCFSGDPINAKWFGAVGTNSSTVDDTAAIQAALDFSTNFVGLGGQGSASAHASFGGLEVVIPEGVYFYSQLGIPSHVSVRGEGPMRTTLKRLTGQSGNAIYVKDGDGQRVTIRDLSIDGSWMAGTNVVNTEGNGLFLARTNYPNTVDGWPTVANVYIYNCPKSGLYVGQYELNAFAKIGGMRGAQVENCHFFANGEYGLVVDSTDGVYRDNYYYNNGIDGVYVRSSAVMNQFVGGRSYFNVRDGLHAQGTKFNPVKALSLVGFRADQNGRTDDSGSGIYLTNVWESTLSGVISFGNTRDGVTVMTSTDIGITGAGVEFDYGVSDYGVQNYGIYISADSTNIVADASIGFGHSSNDVYIGNTLTSRARTREPNTTKGNFRVDGSLQAFGKVELQNSTLTNGPKITLESVTDQPAATMFVKDASNSRFIFAPQAGSNYVNFYLGGFGSGQANSREAWIIGDTPQAGTSTNETAKPFYLVAPRGTGSGSAASGFFRFYSPVAGSSGTTLHSTREVARIDGAGTSTASSLLLDDGTSLNRVKISSGGERALYLGTEPSFGGGSGNATTNGNNVFTGTNLFSGPVTITTGNVTTQNVTQLNLDPSIRISISNLDSNVLSQSEGDSLYQPFAPLLSSVSALGANGILARTSSTDVTPRTITGGPGISIADGDGASGNPTIGLNLTNEINGGLPNASTGKVHWSEIIGMPAGIADGADAQGAFTWDIETDVDTTSATATAVYTNLISEGYTHQVRLFVTAGGPTNQGSWQHNVAIGRSSAVTNFGTSLYSGLALGSGVGMTSYCSQSGGSFVVYVKGITNENVHWNIVGSRITTTNGAPASGGGQIFLVNEAFEGTGNPGGWTTSGSPNWDYTTNQINGSQSFYAATTSDLAYYPFTSGTNTWLKARFRIDSLATAFDFLSFRDSAGSTTLAKMNVRTNGSVRAYQGTQFTASSSGAVVAGTNGYLWLQYIPSTGANGIVNAYLSSSSTRPGSPTAAVTTGDATATPGQIRLLGGAVVFDDVQVSETDIP